MNCLRQGGHKTSAFILWALKKNIGNACGNRKVGLREGGVSLSLPSSQITSDSNNFNLCLQTMWVLAGDVRPEAQDETPLDVRTRVYW